MCNVVFVSPFLRKVMENVRNARAVVDGPFERRNAVGCAFLRRVGSGRVQRVTDVDRVQDRFGHLIVEAELPQLRAPCCDNCEGDGLVVRHPDTEVVTAATRTITQTIAIEYGS